jgi:hypothetical protein
MHTAYSALRAAGGHQRAGVFAPQDPHRARSGTFELRTLVSAFNTLKLNLAALSSSSPPSRPLTATDVFESFQCAFERLRSAHPSQVRALPPRGWSGRGAGAVLSYCYCGKQCQRAPPPPPPPPRRRRSWAGRRDSTPTPMTTRCQARRSQHPRRPGPRTVCATLRASRVECWSSRTAPTSAPSAASAWRRPRRRRCPAATGTTASASDGCASTAWTSCVRSVGCSCRRGRGSATMRRSGCWSALIGWPLVTRKALWLCKPQRCWSKCCKKSRITCTRSTASGPASICGASSRAQCSGGGRPPSWGTRRRSTTSDVATGAGRAYTIHKDAEKAVEWLRKAASQGHAGAQNNLGLCYADGEGVRKDADKAVEWFRKATAQGCADAQCCLGARY